MPNEIINRRTEEMLTDILKELLRARANFPSANYSTLALMEEVGELAQAQLKAMAAKQRFDKEIPDDYKEYNLMIEPYRNRIRKEAVQVAVMAIRIATETDASLANVYIQPN